MVGGESLAKCPKCRESCVSGDFGGVFWIGCNSCAYQLEDDSKEVIILHNLLSEAAYKNQLKKYEDQ